MTREDAITYLDKMAEARKVLISAPDPEKEYFYNETFPLNTDPSVHMYNVTVLIDALGYPFMFKTRDSDVLPWEISLYWKGITFFEICSNTDMKRHRERRVKK